MYRGNDINQMKKLETLLDDLTQMFIPTLDKLINAMNTELQQSVTSGKQPQYWQDASLTLEEKKNLKNKIKLYRAESDQDDSEIQAGITFEEIEKEWLSIDVKHINKSVPEEPTIEFSVEHGMTWPSGWPSPKSPKSPKKKTRKRKKKRKRKVKKKKTKRKKRKKKKKN